MKIEGLAVPVKAIDLDQVMEAIGLGKTTVYALIKTNQFPRPLKIGKSSRWLTTDIAKWLSERVAERDNARKEG